MAGPRKYDRQKNFIGGMNSFQYAADLPETQSQLLQNFYILDNGRAVTRPGADQVDSNPTTFTHISPSGVVQGLAFLDSFTNGQFILMGQGGKLYKWNGAAWSTSLAFTLTSTTSEFCAVQGIDKLLISDGVKAMQLWDGVNFTACSTGGSDTTATNGPTGATTVAFIAGMFVCAGPAMTQGTGSGVQTFLADSLVFSNYLGGAEGTWNNSTNSFRVGNGDGEPIVGLAVVQSTAEVYPIYQLAVLKSNSVWLISIAPGSFSNGFTGMFAAFSTSPQGDQVGTGIGCVGKNAFCLYQNDLLFMSYQGVQSLQRMQAAAGQYQLSSPLSEPIQTYIDQINWAYASGIVAVKYNQWAIFWVPLGNSTVNNTALVWDGRIGQWFTWTGWTPSAAIVARFTSGTTYRSAITFGSTQAGIQLIMGNSDGTVNVWKDSQTLLYLDDTYFDNGVPIAQSINTRSFIFGSLDFLKKGRSCNIRFNQGNATVNLYAYYDLAQDDNWQASVEPGGAVLPFVLPVVLASSKPVQVWRSLEGLPYFNELYINFQISSGWVDIRQVTVAAFQKMDRNPNA